MEALNFPEVNTTLTSSDPNVRPLPVFADKNYEACVMAFKPSPEEIEALTNDGVLWVVVYHKADGFPPIMLTTDKPITNETKAEKTPKK